MDFLLQSSVKKQHHYIQFHIEYETTESFLHELIEKTHGKRVEFGVSRPKIDESAPKLILA